MALAVVLIAALFASCADVASDRPEAASLVVPTVSGGQFDFGEHEGKDIVLWFWAPW